MDLEPVRPLTQSSPTSIRNHLENPTHERLFGTLEKLITGGRFTTETDRDAFWQSVVFSNLIQRLLLTRERRPTRPDWLPARLAFVRHLRQYRPDVVLVLGSQTWNEGLSGPGFLPTRPVEGAPLPWLFEWQITDDHSALAMPVRHPTGSRGRHPFRLSDWQGPVRTMLARGYARVEAQGR